MKQTQTINLHRSSTHFLRAALAAIGLIMLALCVFALPAGISSDETGRYRIILAALYIPAIPFFYALYQTFQLLKYIDTDKAFSELSVKALQRIKQCGLIIAGLFLVDAPYIYDVAQDDDAPGVVAITLVIIGASLTISVFAAVLERLLKDAIAIKSEHDLTI